MKVVNRVMSLLAVGMVGISSMAQAQTVVSYYTTGAFSSGTATCTAPGTTTQCVDGGANPYTLSFTGVGTSATPLNVLAPTSALFGNFLLTGQGETTLNTGNLVFTLFINQTAPAPGGQATTVGSITGSIHTVSGTTGSSLIWSPVPQNMFIGNVTYHLVYDQGTQGFNIPAELNKSINGQITATPEPGTTALFATGLAGLIPVVIRRRRKNNAA